MRPRSPNPLIAAVDTSDLRRAEDLARSLAGVVGMLKVGLELFTAGGPDAVRTVAAHAPVFLDLKLHDIPNTVRGAARAAGALGVDLLSVHALGGPDMVAAAVEGARRGAEGAGAEPPAVVAITVLSSLAGEGLASPASLAFEAVHAGAAGVVVSGEDVRTVREVLGDEAVLIVPGIRPEGTDGHDHERVLTPAEALAAGADYLVVGRAITSTADPRAAARSILAAL
jgi:orotidine-5'-phosphate decarboxylase